MKKKVYLIQEDERLKYEDANTGLILYYRRLTIDKWLKSSQAAANKNSLEYAVELALDSVIDWENVLDQNDKPIKFERELLNKLDCASVLRFVSGVGIINTNREKEAKN